MLLADFGFGAYGIKYAQRVLEIFWRLVTSDKPFHRKNTD